MGKTGFLSVLSGSKPLRCFKTCAKRHARGASCVFGMEYEIASELAVQNFKLEVHYKRFLLNLSSQNRVHLSRRTPRKNEWQKAKDLQQKEHELPGKQLVEDIKLCVYSKSYAFILMVSVMSLTALVRATFMLR